ncbi:hypothetical protein IC582_027767 [Cucumis melo]
MAILDDGRSIDDRSTEKQSERKIPPSLDGYSTDDDDNVSPVVFAKSYFCACPISTFLCLLSASHCNNGLAGNFMG